LQDGHERTRSSADNPFYSAQVDEIPERAVYNRIEENFVFKLLVVVTKCGHSAEHVDVK